jgi:acyl-CoA synthetase (AMP-forming)/AMP-acid ligase II
MLGLMQERPLLISSLIEHANQFHGDVEIVTRTVEGPIHRCTWSDIHRRSRQAAKALLALGVAPGDRVGTIAWNTYRHLELYFGVSGMGAVLHTINRGSSPIRSSTSPITPRIDTCSSTSRSRRSSRSSRRSSRRSRDSSR